LKSEVYTGDAGELLKKYLAGHSYSNITIVTDFNVSKHCLPLIRNVFENAEIIEIPPGEQEKNIENCKLIWERLIPFADRQSLLISLGGGMITDLGGFTASVFKRGIHSVYIPTTLLGMVDAATGGKTGIDFMGEKNMIGTFSMPEAVLIDPKFLKTLPERELKSGFAEVLKYGLIADASLWDKVKDIDSKQFNWEDIISRCVEIKRQITDEDPLEKGFRKILNFGHTFGHALESYSLEHDSDPLLHGEAVATGMVLETEMSFRKGLIAEKAKEEIIKMLFAHFEKYSINRNAFEDIHVLMRHDKKSLGGTVKMALLEGIGNSAYDVECMRSEIEEVYNWYCAL
jgi:3-dehydroquinate synthase